MTARIHGGGCVPSLLAVLLPDLHIDRLLRGRAAFDTPARLQRLALCRWCAPITTNTSPPELLVYVIPLSTCYYCSIRRSS